MSAVMFRVPIEIECVKCGHMSQYIFTLHSGGAWEANCHHVVAGGPGGSALFIDVPCEACGALYAVKYDPLGLTAAD